MSCPFRAAFGRVTPGEEDKAATGTASPPAACPFSGARAAGGGGNAPAAAALGIDASGPAAPATAAPATCPFGFGSGKARPGLTDLDCPK